MEKNKKTIDIILTDVTQCGGTERTVLSTADYLSTAGFKVRVVSINSKDGMVPFFPISKKIPIIHLSSHSYTNLGIKDKIIGWLTSAIKLRNWLKNSSSDLIISTSRNTNFFSIIFKNKNQIVIGCEHFAFNVPMNSILRKIRDKLYKKLDKLVVLTYRDQQYYSNKGISTIVIPNAIPLNERNLSKITKDKIAIAIGRHTDQKAFDHLIRIWARVSEEMSDWKLYIIGEGPLLNSNMELSKELNLKNVEFKNFTKNISKYYESASLYLMTSKYEAFPMVLIESKYYGCINIAFDCDTGPSEIIKDGEDGIIVPVDNDELFIENILRISNNEILRNRLSVSAIKNSQQFIKEQILPHWITLINEL